jgi:hypothetical protein
LVARAARPIASAAVPRMMQFRLVSRSRYPKYG